MSVLYLHDDVPVIDTAPGVAVRHLVGELLLARLMEMTENASTVLADEAAEHIISVLNGRVELSIGDRRWTLDSGNAALVPAGLVCQLTARQGSSRCQVMSTPPDVSLIRHLLHLEHAEHGFD